MRIDLNSILIKHQIKSKKLSHYVEKSFCKNNIHYFFKIEDCIPYNCLIKNNYDDYMELLRTTHQPEHSLEEFKKLKNNFIFDEIKKIQCHYDEKLSKIIINDGVHRLSIIKYLNNNELESKYMNIVFPNNVIRRLKALILGTTSNIKLYNHWNNSYSNGYHSFSINNFFHQGQRNPIKRLKIFNDHIDFKNKKVLDLGCNTGGMLFHLNDIKSGTGIEFDKRCLEFSNYFKKILCCGNINFYNYDLNNYSITEEYDIIFVLSLGSWVKNWKKLYENCIEKSKVIVLEINNVEEGKPQIEFFKNKYCKIKEIIESSQDDITKNYKRKTYIIK